MWTRVCQIIFVALCCRSVSAVAPDVVAIPAAPASRAEFRPLGGVGGYWTLDYATGEIAPGGLNLGTAAVYDNTATSAGSGYATTPGDPNNAVGDSMWMANDGLLDSLSFSIFNSDTSAGPLSRADVEINLYDAYDIVLGTIVLDDLTIDPDLNPGDVGFFTVENLQPESINLPYNCMYTLLFTDVQGGADSIGQALYDSPSVGESPNFFYQGPLDVSSGEHGVAFIDGVPVANFYFAISVENPAPLDILWDAGPPQTVSFFGNESWLGYTSGNFPECDQRWAVMPFRITAAGTVIKELQADWFISGGEADHVSFFIWNRTGLAAPSSPADVFLQGELGPVDAGGRDYRSAPFFQHFHTHDVNIAIPPGDYYLTIYGEGTFPGDPDPNNNALAWVSGSNYVPEELEQEFFWRSCNFPDPGFQEYAPDHIQPGAGMTDPDDRWNFAYMFRGIVCLGDFDGDGAVSAADLAQLLGSWGPCAGDCPADFNSDGEVDAFDLAQLLGAWGPCE